MYGKVDYWYTQIKARLSELVAASWIIGQGPFVEVVCCAQETGAMKSRVDADWLLPAL